MDSIQVYEGNGIPIAPTLENPHDWPFFWLLRAYPGDTLRDPEQGIHTFEEIGRIYRRTSGKNLYIKTINFHTNKGKFTVTRSSRNMRTMLRDTGGWSNLTRPEEQEPPF